MAALAAQKLQIIRTLVETAPDAALRSLELALANATGGALATVRAIVEDETADRYVRNTILSPIAPLCQPRGADLPQFPRRALALLWIALKAEAPRQVAEGAARCNPWDLDNGAPDVFNQLCKIAARGLRQPTRPEFEAVGQICDAAELADYLDLSVIVRNALPRLSEWVSRMNGERAASARLAYRDACAISSDAGPRMFEMLAAHLPEPWRILRVISAVMDRPNDRYLASSEVKAFGERMLADIEASIEQVRGFDLSGGAGAGREAAASAQRIANQLTEFEQAVDVAKDGPWGKRLAKFKQSAAQAAETRMNAADKELALALPSRPISMMGKMGGGKGVPKLDAAPDETLVRRAAAALAFIEDLRPCAAQAGYGATRTKALEKLNQRLDQYIEDCLHVARTAEGGDPQIARAYLDIAAGYIVHTRDEKTAEIVRRRAVAAMAA
ncbi:hypothetical protein G5B46_07320 [Caulobacter sp. 602-2]|uniref:Uncharacterized protein n=1 Tax=Caulobacter sp. 602-2 TaxID=2710887 RepID=A0A6G4QV36_9CAUL|nr:hypothetical protein [Caulobacter sp. 602-2]NGM49411.1 hypothetical protein [Caulobacter sp. 602-2]